MKWIMAKTVGGPLDGMYFAVGEGQEEIVGMGEMEMRTVQAVNADGESLYLDADGNASTQPANDDYSLRQPMTTLEPVERYVKDSSTLREFKGEEKGLSRFAFDGFDLEQVCEFRYATG